MSRLVTVLVMCMVLVAGCSGMPTSGNGNGDSTDGSENVVTYTHESDNTTFTLEADNNTETYDIGLKGPIDPPYDGYAVNISIGLYCEALEETAYNYTESNDTYASDEYTKTYPSGEAETVEGIPERIFTDYEPNDVSATITAQNGTVLASCSVNGKDDFTFD